MPLISTRSLICSLLLLPALAVAQEIPETGAGSEATTSLEAPTPEGEAAAPQGDASRIGPAPHDKGQVVFFRPPKMMGAAIGFKVRHGDTELGKLRNGKYFVATLEAGTYDFTVHSETKDVLTMEIEAGETYYVQGTLSMGVMVGRPNLTPSDETAFAHVSGKLKLAP